MRKLTELNVTNQLKREFFPINIIETVEKPRFLRNRNLKPIYSNNPKIWNLPNLGRFQRSLCLHSYK